MRKPKRKWKRLFVVGGVVCAFIAGLVVGMAWGPEEAGAPAADDRAAPGADEHGTTWTCSMHPQVQQPHPGQCPLCGMDLVPVAAHEDDASSHGDRPRLSVSDSAKALMDVAASPVERRFAEVDVRMVGKVGYDETRMASITAWTAGRLERLYVDYTGVNVKRGDHLVEIYSPDLLIAQDELHRAARGLTGLPGSAPEVLRETARATRDAARRKLRLLGLSENQIARAEETGAVSDRITVYAPMGGTVVAKEAREGEYVDVGDPIYRIADLSRVWVRLDAYESDLIWLHYGQEVAFEVEAYPGESFSGRIAFIDPVLDARTRTAKVRVNVENPDGRLKPEMFVRAVVHAKIAGRGKVMDPGLAGKWISPMHPEVIKDGPGTCDVCGMPLVRAESLGYVAAMADETEAPLVIPATAPLVTGKRAVVYVEVPDTERPTFEARTVELGPRAGDSFVVEGGLAEGERVVTRGNFKIDSALQIQAKPSMMAPEEEAPKPPAGGPEGPAMPAMPDMMMKHEAPASFQAALRSLVGAYMEVQSALAGDDAGRASAGLEAVRNALDAVNADELEGHGAVMWQDVRKVLSASLEEMGKAGDIGGMRASFHAFSTALIAVSKSFGLGEGGAVYQVHCPMAFDNKGADWIQLNREVLNPYYGSAMLRCGAVTATLSEAEEAAALSEEAPESGSTGNE